jgi:hypothetical protein
VLSPRQKLAPPWRLLGFFYLALYARRSPAVAVARGSMAGVVKAHHGTGVLGRLGPDVSAVRLQNLAAEGEADATAAVLLAMGSL